MWPNAPLAFFFMAVSATGDPQRLERVPADQAVRLADGRFIGVRLWPGKGVPIVVLHGLLDCGAGWDPYASATARPVVAIDLPGFGCSDLPRRPRVSAYAEDVIEVLAALEISRYVLLGHSLGGAVATAIAERAPERAVALILIAPAGFGRIRMAEAVSLPGVREMTRVALPLALANPFVLRATFSRFVTRGAAIDSGTLARTRDRASGSVAGARDGTRAVVAAGLSKHAFQHRRVNYDGPVRALWGDGDRVVSPSHARGVERALPQARVEIWKGMGHHPEFERFDAFFTYIEQACSDGDAAARLPRAVAGRDGDLAAPARSRGLDVRAGRLSGAVDPAAGALPA